MNLLRHIMLMALVVTAVAAMAQRKVTPVETDDKKPEAPVLHYYDKHGNALKEPVLFLAQLDTVQSVSQAAKPVYPALDALEFGVNFFDGILAIAGQKHGGADLWASLSLWNWVYPTMEIGLGTAKGHIDSEHFYYKEKVAPYFKLGADYNFLYKSDPKYRFMAGIRAGYSPFTYSYSDITEASELWDKSHGAPFTDNKSYAWWGEILGGVRVNIWREWSLGWTFRYHFMLRQPHSYITDAEGNQAQIQPWAVPGYGKRTGHITATFSLIYTLPLSRKKAAISEPK